MAQAKNDPNAQYRREEMLLDVAFHKMVVEMFTTEQESLDQRITTLRTEVKEIAKRTEDQTGLAAEVTHRKGVVERLGDKIQSMQIELKSPPKGTLLQPAPTPIRTEGKEALGRPAAAGPGRLRLLTP